MHQQYIVRQFHSLLEHVQIYKERKNLAYTLQDARGVVSKLELIMGVMMHVLFVFFYLIIFDVSIAVQDRLHC